MKQASMAENPLIVSYKRDLDNDEFLYDAAQEAVVCSLAELYGQLVLRHQSSLKPWFLRALSCFSLGSGFKVGRSSVKGLYIWGTVGTGKTYLMDKFYNALPMERKERMHFHRFMRRIHGELAELQGEKNPLVSIAATWANKYEVLCLDEFFVSDITDAMLLGGLLDGLLNKGMVLVTTSNVEPCKLYKDGLQRARFLPAIDLILSNTKVVSLNAKVDFRLRSLEKLEIYHFPLDVQAEKQMFDYFKQLAPDAWEQGALVDLDGRKVASKYVSEDVVWFDFEVLCGGPRSQRDYIELAMVYHALLLSGVPVLGVSSEDKARRFILLLDELYDRNVKLIISADVPIECLYQGSKLSFEFERAQSRLIEMQSHAYMAKPHLP